MTESWQLQVRITDAASQMQGQRCVDSEGLADDIRIVFRGKEWLSSEDGQQSPLFRSELLCTKKVNIQVGDDELFKMRDSHNVPSLAVRGRVCGAGATLSFRPGACHPVWRAQVVGARP